MSWPHHLWFAWFWPSIKGNGPEDLTSVAVAGVVTAIVYPRLRRWIETELDRLHAKADHTADLLHHIVDHSDHIPNDDPLGRSWHDRRPPRGR